MSDSIQILQMALCLMTSTVGNTLAMKKSRNATSKDLDYPFNKEACICKFLLCSFPLSMNQGDIVSQQYISSARSEFLMSKWDSDRRLAALYLIQISHSRLKECMKIFLETQVVYFFIGWSHDRFTTHSQDMTAT